jgi:hypothetical protein
VDDSDIFSGEHRVGRIQVSGLHIIATYLDSAQDTKAITKTLDSNLKFIAFQLFFGVKDVDGATAVIA